MQAVSHMGSSSPATIMSVLLLGGLWALGRKIELIFVTPLTSFGALLSWLLKLLISRPRPNSGLVLLLQENNGLSFLSGYVVYAVVFYGFLFYLVPRLVK